MITDNQVWFALIPFIRSQLQELGLGDVTVIQSYQPTQQGVEPNPVVAINRISAKRYGWPEDTSYYDEAEDKVVNRQAYWLECTYQVNALAIQDPAELGSKTAFDYVDIVAALMQTRSAQDYLRGYGIGILRIQPLRVDYFVDDKGRHEQVPSFDFTLTYRQVLNAEVAPLQSITAEIYEV